jgi:hypothetical protein
VSELPIACSLDTDGFRRRLEQFRETFERGLLATDRFPGGGRFRFRSVPGLEDELRSLAERERACCPFFRFEIATRGDEIWWEARVEGGAEPILEEFLGLPERLTRRRRRGSARPGR